MSGEDQERFEDYLELERFIEDLQAGRAAYPPQEMTPAQARVYRMAMLFHAATPGVSEPSADFAAQLQARLAQEINSPREVLPSGAPPVVGPGAQPVPRPKPQPIPARPKRRMPRRWLLASSVTAAASMAVGAGVEYVAEMAMHRSQPATTRSGPDLVIKLDSVLEWFPVITVDELGDEAIRFRAEDQSGASGLTGYVVRSDGTHSDSTRGYPGTHRDEIIAMSAACTHMGCIVDWSSADRNFHCPCHGGVFDEDGTVNRLSSSIYPGPLPRLEVRVDNGQVYVRMPAR